MLVNEVGSQQSLLAAEDGNLTLIPREIHSLDFLWEVITFYKHYDCADNRNIQIAENSTNSVFISDKNQLSRVIGNMLKNALEASAEPEAVTAGCEQTSIGSIRILGAQPTIYQTQCTRSDIQPVVYNKRVRTRCRDLQHEASRGTFSQWICHLHLHPR